MVKTYRSTSRYSVIWNLVVIILSLGQGSGDAKDLFTVCTHQEQNPGCRHHDNTTLLCTDFIPDDPLGFEEVDVTWCSSRPNEERLDIKEDLFMNNNWTFVKSFTYIKSQNIGFHTYIAPFAFKQMTKLERIRLHVLKSQLFLNSQSFCGVDNLKSLNFSGSTYLEQHFVTQVFLLNQCMPNLEELSLSGISLHHDLDFDDGFLSLILKRPIRTLDLRFLHVKKLNITTVINNCAHLEYLYLSDTMFEEVDHGLRSGGICPQLKLVDVSRAQFTFMKLFCLIRNLGDTTSALKVDGDFQFLLHTETLIWDRLCPLGRPMPLSIKSVKLSLETPSVLRQLFMRNNYIDVFDAEINWLSSSVKFLDLSNNRFGYLNPLFFSSGENFRHVNLADNRLSNMVDRSAEDFVKLFFPLAELRYLGLAKNNLTFLPKYSF